MTEPHPAASRRPIVRLWLYVVAALMVLTLVVGGATRLTESGLSIVEWKPVTGVVPPMSQDAWQAEFGKYQQIPQYRELNRGMSLEEFKTIYWWEWSHRLLARTIGAVFLLPFVFFLWRGWIDPRLKARLWTLFGAGAALGAVGWWMVSSGLADSSRVSVSQYRLAFHLTLACAIYAAILWTARGLHRRIAGEAPWRLRASAAGLMVLVLLQIYLGALVAGLNAGLVFNTWPDIDGTLIPSAERLWFDTPVWRNLFENTLTVQFNHRMVAYLLWIVAALHAVDAFRSRGVVAGRNGALVLAAIVTLQAGIGIMTLLHQVPLPLALLHQLTGILVLTVAVIHAQRLSANAAAAVPHSAPFPADSSIPRSTA
ncbi:COX15/CtaA family protein [Rhodoplanes sp. Z2-YC6860]|uniref:COX15/CtaA family protein n=1 Tax=Rhodoplanes sp. Z2-YC6860 TaxID=674703 RepID=UPI00078C7ADC|nr:COX15/CtaA family protein [Rhodoplanes sp. Z2-YC6860]AMN42259.1 cytochrome oxidase assembly protein [Rhodoplanes sp. Z2-YC6860]